MNFERMPMYGCTFKALHVHCRKLYSRNNTSEGPKGWAVGADSDPMDLVCPIKLVTLDPISWRKQAQLQFLSRIS